MAGVRKKPQPNGKYRGWYQDYHGKRQTFTGTRKEGETRRMAERLEDEHRQVKLGYRPAPTNASEHKRRPFVEVAAEYQQWGESQGGRNGFPWGERHAVTRRAHLAWWAERLGLAVLGDLVGSLGAVEKELRQVQAKGRTGKTVASYAESIKALCLWCVKRRYLDADPLDGLARFDTTPKTQRRALTDDEIAALLGVTPVNRRIVYEVALCSGLRVNELRNLKVAHLDMERAGLRLDAPWTKNRRAGFQPISADLARRLEERSEGKPKDASLLDMLGWPANAFDYDLDAAGLDKRTVEGVLSFHSLRVTFITRVIESGANLKEAQTLARHLTPQLTMNVYARTRDERLSEVAELMAKNTLPGQDRALFVHKKAAGAENQVITPCKTMPYRASILAPPTGVEPVSPE